MPTEQQDSALAQLAACQTDLLWGPSLLSSSITSGRTALQTVTDGSSILKGHDATARVFVTVMVKVRSEHLLHQSLERHWKRTLRIES